ncbi:hypothetical protein Vadar_007490 [Vaccinium darrowii]|uniref:Uncharacterized protein n=1 Tax=Vaccinium darrowii TaxID=229202 RepID=A0ACB7ZB15_9ERIC|nr:hypothetical protein Vadar_007490 [Vaccinium darrowii]
MAAFSFFSWSWGRWANNAIDLFRQLSLNMRVFDQIGHDPLQCGRGRIGACVKELAAEGHHLLLVELSLLVRKLQIHQGVHVCHHTLFVRFYLSMLSSFDNFHSGSNKRDQDILSTLAQL